MAMTNKEIAEKFATLADLLEIEGANPFRINAYRNAADYIAGRPDPVCRMVDRGEDLSKLPHIGRDLAQKIAQLCDSGELELLDEVAARTPIVLSDLMKLPGLGPKRVKTLYRELGIRSAEDLLEAAAAGQVRTLAGFGEKTEESILRRLQKYTTTERRMRRSEAREAAEPLLRYLGDVPGVKKVVLAGSYRRCKETIGDLDILVTAKRDSGVMSRLADYKEVAEVASSGTTRSTVRLRSGLQVDVRLVPAVSYGAALHYFTGSKAHNIRIRGLAQKKGLKVNEYGVFRGKTRVAGKTEKEVFAAVGLPYIEPELRRDQGEIEAAKKGKLPRLLSAGNIRGDLHCHTRATDGHNSIEEMVNAARDRGYDYIAITDHSRHLAVANGLDARRLAAQIRKIDKLNATLDDIVVLKSCEVDILADGTLDLPDSVLEKLDFTVCAVHSAFNLSREKQTERIIRAMDNPYFTILAHPTGRLINEREPYDIDLEKLLRAARERSCYLELNSHPLRLDLNGDACRLARDAGVRIAVSTDAHSVTDLAYMEYGVEQARRGWLEKADVINTRPLKSLLRLLRRG